MSISRNNKLFKQKQLNIVVNNEKTLKLATVILHNHKLKTNHSINYIETTSYKSSLTGVNSQIFNNHTHIYVHRRKMAL